MMRFRRNDIANVMQDRGGGKQSPIMLLKSMQRTDLIEEPRRKHGNMLPMHTFVAKSFSKRFGSGKASIEFLSARFVRPDPFGKPIEQYAFAKSRIACGNASDLERTHDLLDDLPPCHNNFGTLLGNAADFFA